MTVKDERFYTWDELVGRYTDKWVIVEEPELTEAGFIKSGRLIGVCDDTEIDEFVVSCYKENGVSQHMCWCSPKVP